MRRLGEIFDKENKGSNGPAFQEETIDRRAKRKQTATRKLLALRTFAIALPAIVLTTVAGTGLWAWQTGRLDTNKYYLEEALYSATSFLGLEIENVVVDGRNYTSVEEVVTAIGLESGGPILRFDPQDAQDRFELLPWVKSATIWRQLPNTIKIELEEREPLALWQKNYRHALVDYDGEVIPDAPVADHRHLPIVVGDNAAYHAEELLASLRQEPQLFKQVKSIVHVSNRRWTVLLDNDVYVVLPEEAIEEAWHRLAKLQENKKILDRAIKFVDLRLPDRVVVRLIGETSDSANLEKNT